MLKKLEHNLCLCTFVLSTARRVLANSWWLKVCLQPVLLFTMGFKLNVMRCHVFIKLWTKRSTDTLDLFFKLVLAFAYIEILVNMIKNRSGTNIKVGSGSAIRWWFRLGSHRQVLCLWLHATRVLGQIANALQSVEVFIAAAHQQWLSISADIVVGAALQGGQHEAIWLVAAHVFCIGGHG